MAVRTFNSKEFPIKNQGLNKIFHIEPLDLYAISIKDTFLVLLITPNLSEEGTIPIMGAIDVNRITTELLHVHAINREIVMSSRSRVQSGITSGRYRISIHRLSSKSMSTYTIYASPQDFTAVKSCADDGSPLCKDYIERLYRMYLIIRYNAPKDVCGVIVPFLIAFDPDELEQLPLDVRIKGAVRRN